MTQAQIEHPAYCVIQSDNSFLVHNCIFPFLTFSYFEFKIKPFFPKTKIPVFELTTDQFSARSHKHYTDDQLFWEKEKSFQ